MNKMKVYKFQRFNGGQAMLLATIFFLFIILTLVFGLVVPVVNHVKQVSLSNNSKQSFILAESGLEDILYRLENNKNVPSGNITIALNGATSTYNVVDSVGGKTVSATATTSKAVRKSQMSLVLGTGVSFHFGIQSGNGGFTLANSSAIVGNAFSTGPITGSGNYIYGDTVSALSSGLVTGIHATGTVYAHTINTSTIDKDAYYQNISNTTVSGANCTSNSHCHPGSPDQPSVDLPISDDQINEWESDAAAGGTMDSSFCDSFSSNTCTITSSKTIGPIKIPFNLTIKNNSGIVTMAGPVWVVGNISTQTGSTIKVASSLGNQNVAFIADDPSNPATSGKVDIGQSTQFFGSGDPHSFVFMISQNNSAEQGGSNMAISMGQGSSALVGYASHGLITLSQSVNIKEATAYKISLSQSARVTYDTGLPNLLFESGPGGTYSILNWGEIE